MPQWISEWNPHLVLCCYLFKYKTLAEKIRDFLPQPSISASQTVLVEHSNEAMRDDGADDDDGAVADADAGAGEAMARLDDNEDLV